MSAARIEGEDEARAAIEAGLPAFRRSLLGSPFWREALGARGSGPGDLGGLGDLPDLPTLDRETLAERGSEVASLDPDHGGLVTVQTSGSTGRPLDVLRSDYECLSMWAVLRFWLAWAGLCVPDRPRVVLLCALPGEIEYSVRLPILGDGALHRISTRRPGAEARLLRVRPSVIFSDPAGLHWLAARSRQPAPLLLLSSAQHLSRELRHRLARAIPAPLIDYYSTTETGPVAWSCLDHPDRHHVLVPGVWVESVGGELAVTRLRPGPLPLLRYRTGDRGEVVRDRCGCGYRGWSLLRLAGRRACAFLTPGGETVDAWSLAWLFKHYPLRGFRLSQHAVVDFELEVDAPDGRDLADLRERLIRQLERLGWSRPRIRITAGAALASPGGKPEPFRRLPGVSA
jgi:phenylacetate-CoA ligase